MGAIRDTASREAERGKGAKAPQGEAAPRPVLRVKGRAKNNKTTNATEAAAENTAEGTTSEKKHLKLSQRT